MSLFGKVAGTFNPVYGIVDSLTSKIRNRAKSQPVAPSLPASNTFVLPSQLSGGLKISQTGGPISPANQSSYYGAGATSSPTPVAPTSAYPSSSSFLPPSMAFSGSSSATALPSYSRTSSAPNVPRFDSSLLTDAEKKARKAEQSFYGFLSPSSEEQNAQKELDQLSSSFSQGVTAIEDKTIPLEFITGQLRSLEDRALNLAEPLEAKLARLQADRLGALEASKFALDRADSDLDRLRKAQEAASTLPAGEGFTLGKDQVRYDANGNVIASNAGVGDGFGGGFGQVSPEAQNWASLITSGQAKLSDVPSDIRSQVASAVAGAPQTQTKAQLNASNTANEAINAINSALAALDPAGLSTADSPLGRTLGGFIPGTDARDLKGYLSTVQALIGFDTLQKMREASPTGGALGQVSERELSFLQSAQGSIEGSLSTPTLKKNLERILKSFQRVRAINTPGISAEEYLGMFPDASDAELREIIQRESGGFSYVGGDTNSALNRPQRNNNPGNIKAGGIADKYAVSVDEQGHLIFPSAEYGFAAMKEDVAAKISGQSRYLPKNPTIAQLGSVYAEDPNWAKSVARILGVNVNTATSSVGLDSLVKAIAKQEGFYA